MLKSKCIFAGKNKRNCQLYSANLSLCDCRMTQKEWEKEFKSVVKEAMKVVEGKK